jgi:NAD-dependent SIR2 family protein deacetylase
VCYSLNSFEVAICQAARSTWKVAKPGYQTGSEQLTVGKLKPNVLLYGEAHSDDKEIIKAIDDDLETCPDLLLVVGTKLGIPGARSIATRLCRATQSSGGFAVWINKEEPTSSSRPLFNSMLKGDCDAIMDDTWCWL